MIDHPPHRLGVWGEALAARRLEAEGWTVLARNYRLGRREIDLVVGCGASLAFVEVKTRTGSGFGGPESAVDWRKRAEIESVARAWLAGHPCGDAAVRFDVVAIEVDKEGRLCRYEHIEDAWRPNS